VMHFALGFASDRSLKLWRHLIQSYILQRNQVQQYRPIQQLIHESAGSVLLMGV
jgi:hypothetical protein